MTPNNSSRERRREERPIARTEHAGEVEGSENIEESIREREFFRDQAELFAEEERDRLENEAAAAWRGGGIIQRLAGYKRYTSAFALASVLVGYAANKSPEQLQEVGEISENQIEQAAPDVEVLADAELEASIRKLMQERPFDAAQRIDAFKDKPFAEEVLVDLVKINPDVFEPHIPKIEGQPYFQIVVETMVESDPEYFGIHLPSQNPEPGDYLAEVHPLVVSAIDGSRNPEVRSLEELRKSELEPGTKRLIAQVHQYVHDNHLTLDQAAELVGDQHKFMEALVYTAINGSSQEAERAEYTLSNDAQSRVMDMNLLKGKANRFESVRGATSTELYATIVYGADYARPSTAKPLFDLFHKQMKAEEKDAVSFIEGLDGLEYHQFVNLATLHGKFDEFLTLAESPEEKQELVHRFVADLETVDTDERLSAISQVLVYSKDRFVLGQMRTELEREYREAVESDDEQAQAAYGVLSTLIEGSESWLGERAADYSVELKDRLEVKELFNERGENVQAYYFYNDEDGYWSFMNFVNTYKRSSGWEIEDHGTFVEISKTQESRSIVIYANKPMASVGGEHELMELTTADKAEAVMTENGWTASIADIPDEEWQEGRPNGFSDMYEHMDANERAPHIQVHRGHSYWSGYTQQEVNPETKFFFDGSCGGASEIEKILRSAPDAQVVYNSDEGKAGINDSILANINERILTGEDLDWEEIKQVSERDIGVFYDEDSAPDAAHAYARYIFPHENKAKAAAVEARYQAILETNTKEI